jgi:hypothetical protein
MKRGSAVNERRSGLAMSAGSVVAQMQQKGPQVQGAPGQTNA